MFRAQTLYAHMLTRAPLKVRLHRMQQRSSVAEIGWTPILFGAGGAFCILVVFAREGGHAIPESLKAAVAIAVLSGLLVWLLRGLGKIGLERGLHTATWFIPNLLLNMRGPRADLITILLVVTSSVALVFAMHWERSRRNRRIG